MTNTPTGRTRQSARILVVEDDDAMRDLLVEELSDAGYNVSQAAGGTEGLATIRTANVDLVITDLRMPDLDGFDLIRDIRATNCAPHIIMITAFGSIETAIKAVKLGAYDYITKPFEIDELLIALDNALGVRLLSREVDRLQREVEERYSFGNIVAHSDSMQDVLSLVRRVAVSEVSVLITGESGTGKELIARATHFNSPRRDNPFVAVNIAALPAALIESELFGHVRGAFTDARRDRVGMFAEADGGTLFLDEIGELRPELQAKLLRVLQEGEIRPVGSEHVQKVDVRIVSATNRDLDEMMRDGVFREDLFYRLNVVDILIPPLRQRSPDILPLAETFLAEAAAKLAQRPIRISAAVRRALLAYRWTGNVRELQNVVRRCVALHQDGKIELSDLPAHIREPQSRDSITVAVQQQMTLAELERQFILSVLDEVGGNKSQAARRLGLDRKTLYRKLDEYNKA